MAVPTYATFVDRFPEFDEFELAPLAIEEQIGAASRRVNPDAWGEQQADAILYLAAHLVVNAHRVKCCKLINKDNTTGYLQEYMRMRESIISGDRVI